MSSGCAIINVGLRPVNPSKVVCQCVSDPLKFLRRSDSYPLMTLWIQIHTEGRWNTESFQRDTTALQARSTCLQTSSKDLFFHWNYAVVRWIFHGCFSYEWSNYGSLKMSAAIRSHPCHNGRSGYTRFQSLSRWDNVFLGKWALPYISIEVFSVTNIHSKSFTSL